MNKFPELRQKEIERFLRDFSSPGTLRFKKNNRVGLNRAGNSFTVHNKHGKTR